MSTKEKCTATLPSMRVTESLEVALLRLASNDQRTLSEYIKLALERHCFGHAHSLRCDADGDKPE